MFVHIDADAPPEKLEEIVQLGPTYSPFFDTITRAVPATVKLDNKSTAGRALMERPVSTCVSVSRYADSL